MQKKQSKPPRQAVSMRNISSTNRLFIDSKEFQQLAELERMANFDIDDVRGYFEQLRDSERKRIILETNMQTDVQTEFFYGVDPDQPFQERQHRQLVLYDHPKKGLSIITRQDLQKKPGYKHQQQQPLEKMDTMLVVRAIFPEKTRH